MAQPTELEERPPYVRFERRAEEDRNASIEAGHYVAKDVDFALITPMGSKDTIERRVDEWFPQLQQQVGEQRFKSGWLSAYREMYSAWKEGREIPLSGTPVMSWPALSPAQVQALLHARVRTVEDLASANEETLQRIGMGGRALKQKAVEWIAASQSLGKQSEQIAALKAANEDLKSRNQSLEERLSALEKLLPKQPAGKPL
jgi:hypothetical protein